MSVHRRSTRALARARRSPATVGPAESDPRRNAAAALVVDPAAPIAPIPERTNAVSDHRLGSTAALRSPAIPIAVVAVAALALVVSLWTAGWLGAKPSLPPSGSAPQVVTTRKPTFNGKLSSGTAAVFALGPAVKVRWPVQANAAGRYVTRPPLALPPGNYTLTINDQRSTPFTVSAGENNRPPINAPAIDGATSAEFALSPMRWLVTATAPDGTYQTEVPVALSPGTYTLLIDDAVARQFVVAANAT